MFEVELDGQAKARVELDADALEQIVGNLLGNVEKYAADGGRVRVATVQQGETTTITVSDRGPGVPEGRREAVFEPFRRLSDKLTDGVAGTGIGLAIARDLARMHGGDVRCVPASRGACFQVELHTPRVSDGEAS